MKDNIEKFVSQHRVHFDDEEPSSEAWSKLEKTLPVRRKKIQLHPLAYAASLLIMAVAGWYLSTTIMRKPEMTQPSVQPVAKVISKPVIVEKTDTVLIQVAATTTAATQMNTASTAQNQSVYAEITNYYQEEITKRKSKLYATSAGNDRVLEQVEEELAYMDTLNARAQREMNQGMNVGVVMEQLVQNYRQSIDILDMMLEQVNEEYAQYNE